MARVQVVYGSRHGGAAGIAEKIGEVLRAEGADAVVVNALARPDPSGFDAYVIGSGVYMGSWLKEGTEFIERHQATLATRPVWLFSSGPLPGSTAAKDGKDLLVDALGPVEGPGSGGRRKVDALGAAIHARENRVFLGAFNPNDPPKAMSERLIRMMPAAKGLLPAGDFREWDSIEAWAREIAAQIGSPIAVA